MTTAGLPIADPPPRARLDAALAAVDALAPAPREVAIPLPGGVDLAADLHLPAAGGPAAAIVLATPYDKRLAAYAADARHFADAGYAYVVYDVRGRGKSGGDWRAFVHDREDGRAVVEWVARQPWCDGSVAVSGSSYSGWAAMATAAARPEGLRCIDVQAAAGRWMEEIPYTHGCLQLYFAWWALLTRGRVLEEPDPATLARLVERLPVERIGEAIGDSATWDDIVAHDRLDGFWEDLRLDRHYAGIAVPGLHVAGWHDAEDLTGAIHHFERLAAAGGAPGEQFLVAGPWSHAQTRWPDTACGGVHYGPDAAVDLQAVRRRFLDRYLRGIDNGADDDPRLRLFDTGARRWRAAAAWPARGETTLWLSAGGGEGDAGALAGASPDEEARAGYRYDPRDPAPSLVRFDSTVLEPSLDQSELERRADVLTFTTPPLERPVAVRGWPRLMLRALSDATDTDWHVRLTEVGDDGRSIRLASGCLRAAHRRSLREPEPLVPGVAETFAIELTPLCHVFAAGRRIRLTVTSSDFPWFARNLNRSEPIARQADPLVAVNEVVCGGQQGSRLSLPTASEET